MRMNGKAAEADYDLDAELSGLLSKEETIGRRNIALRRKEIKVGNQNDPHLGLRFWVSIDGIEIAGFSECSALTIETETFDYPEGGQNTYVHRLPVRTKYGNITLKRGINEGQELRTWFMQCIRLGNKAMPRKNVSIIIYDSMQNETRRYELHQAFPVKWTGPDLKADAGAIAVETLEFAHNGLLSIR